jgi:transcriptional regulator NrdR family protein
MTGTGAAARRVRGRLERATEEAVRAARAGEKADRRFAALETLARLYAASLDQAVVREPYAVAKIGPHLLEVLRELRLTPPTVDASGKDQDLSALLADLAAPPVLDSEEF